MGFTESVRTVLTKKYAAFSGRASRSEYWWFQLCFCAVLIALFMVLGFVVDGAGSGVASTGGYTVAGIIGLYSLAMVLPQVALQVRRFHDRNMSGWWYLPLFILLLTPGLKFIAWLALILIGVLPGTAGPNKYGPDPLRPEAIAEVFA